MKLAVRENMAPGSNLEERLEVLRRCGYDGIELVSPATVARDPAELKLILVEAGFGVATVPCDLGLLDPDPKVREATVDSIKNSLDLASYLGATGALCVPIFGKALLPDVSPYKSAVELENELLIAQLQQIGQHAEAVGATLILEPLNRYETHLINRLEQGADVCRAVGSKRVRVMADFFHMNIEEADIPESLRGSKDYVVFIHVADSNRVQPGRGHLDLRSGFSALKEIGYDGYLSVECRLVGNPEDALRESAAKVRSLWAEA